jgi:hypothetical protein
VQRTFVAINEWDVFVSELVLDVQWSKAMTCPGFQVDLPQLLKSTEVGFSCLQLPPDNMDVIADGRARFITRV